MATKKAVKKSDDTEVMSLREAFYYHMKYSLAKDRYNVTSSHAYQALALAVRDQIIERWIETQRAYYDRDVKRVYYLSMEFLMGRTLGNSLMNLGLYDECRTLLSEAGFSIEALEEHEADAGLGNGGLGRLAACFIDSLATLGYPAYGCGIRYDFGIFHQRISDGYQVEEPDEWLRTGNPWQTERPENTFRVKFGGRMIQVTENNRLKHKWVDTSDVLAMPYDMPIPGFGNRTVNTLSLWASRAVESFSLSNFQTGDYLKAVEDSALSETLSRVLYPNDNNSQGRELRLKQEFFLVSASLQDILRRYRKHHNDFKAFPDKVAIQMNDTHPSLAVAELMRLLLDEEELGWDTAWDICTRTFGYTNHTLMPEALEKWPVSLMERLLPRHMSIIYEINHRFLEEVKQKHPGKDDLLHRVSIIEEGGEKTVRMAHLAVVGSHSINGVAQLHTELLKLHVLPDFFMLYPKRFNNKTNGITPRRWLNNCNPDLTTLITKSIGTKWITDLGELKNLEPFAKDASFCKEWREAKKHNKLRLAKYIEDNLGITISPEALLTAQIKRLHEYKRQLLNVLQVIARYRRLKNGEKLIARTVIFSAKAAPAYYLAKLIIKLINCVGDVVNNDIAINGKLKVLFLPNYSVSLAEKIIPAADLSEQISTAGTEASGTGNMKLSLNGALTIGTLDGANVEIRECVGAEHFFLFGLTAEQVAEKKKWGYSPYPIYESDPELKAVIDDIANGRFSNGDTNLFRPIVDTLLGADHFLLLADFRSYMDAQNKVDEYYLKTDEWTRSSILNVARLAKFSSDRTVSEYAKEIWGITPEKI
jgi:starch phosphorylase